MNNIPSEQPSVHESTRQVFELAWSNGSPLPIESVLPNLDDPSNLLTLLQLIHIELQYSWSASQQEGTNSPPKLEEYLERFRVLRTPECLAELLQAELDARRKLGMQPTIDDYCQRFSLLITDTELAELIATPAAETDRGLQAGETRPQLPPPESETSGQDMQTIMPTEEEPMIILGPPDAVEDTSSAKEMATIAPGSQHPSNSSGSQGGTVSSEMAGMESIVIGGQTLPGYDILGELGRGGMGVVYKAHERKLKRIVAVKMILSGIHASEEDMNRFQIEAEAVAQLQHPGIVQIYDVGNHGDKPYITLEFVDGGNLDDLTGGDPLAADHAAGLVIKMCDAIQAAHDQQIIHRDLKPANILITADGDPKITDFGLAKRLDDDSQQTKSGSVMGTPSYMAPEQAGSKQGSIGPTTDVYALGAILYRLLTGRPPFQAETAVDTLIQVVSEDPFPPRRLNPKVPLDVETICLKALQKESDRRYATAAELAEDLRRYSDGKPIQARPVSAWERTRKWARRRPALAGMIAVSGCALLFILIWGSLKNATLRTALGDAETQRQLAEIQTQSATASKEKAEAALTTAEASQRRVTQVLSDMLQQRSPVDAIPWLANELRNKQDTAGTGWSMSQQSWEILIQNTPQPTFHLPIPASRVSGIRLTPDAQMLLAFGTSSRLYFWNPEDGQPLMDPINTGMSPSLVELSPNGQQLIVVQNVEQTAEARRAVMDQGMIVERLLFRLNGLIRAWDLSSRQKLDWKIEHAGPIRSVEYSPDGTMILTASQDSTARLWDAATGQQVGPAMEHNDPVSKAVFSPDGSRIASGTDTGQIYLWDGQTHQRIGSPMSHRSFIQDLKFSPDGTILASASFDDTARLWDGNTGRPLGEPLPHEGNVLGIKFNHRGSQLATISRDWRVRLWDTTTGALLFAPLQHKAIPSEAAFSPDDSLLATSSYDRTVQVWDTTTGRPVGQPLWHHGPVMACRFHPDGRRILTGTGVRIKQPTGGAVRIWDLASDQLNPVVTETSPEIARADMAPDGKHLVTYSASGIVRRRLTDGSVVDRFDIPDLRENLIHIEWNPDRTVMIAASDKQLFGWDFSADPPRPIRLNDPAGFATFNLKENTQRIGQLRFSSVKDSLLVTSTDGWIDIWDLRSQKIVFQKHTALETFVRAEMTKTKAGQRVFYVFQSVAPYITVGVDTSGVDLENHPGIDPGTTSIGTEVQNHGPLINPSQRLGAPKDMRLVGRIDEEERMLVLFDHNRKGSFLLTLEAGPPGGAKVLSDEMAHKETIHFFCANHDGTRLLTASADNTARCWNLLSGKPITPPLQHQGDVRHACFSRSGNLLATASHTPSGGAARIWDSSTGIPLTPPLEHDEAAVVFVDFSPDSSHLVSVDASGVTKIWQLRGTRSLETDDDVLAAAGLATSSRIDDSGALVPIPAAELETLLAKRQTETTTERRFAWYRTQATRCRSSELWPDVIRHAEQMGRLLPESPEPHSLTAHALASMGQMEEAAAALLMATEKGAANSVVWQDAALALLESENAAGFVKLCRQMAEQFSLKDAARRTAWTLCLSPLTQQLLQARVDAESFPMLLNETAETNDNEDFKRVDEDTEEPALSLAAARQHGGVLYRLGHYESAIHVLRATLAKPEEYEEQPRSLADYRPRSNLEIHCWGLLALSEARQGDSAALTFFAAWARAKQQQVAWQEVPWQDRVVLDTLLTEAESLLSSEAAESD